MSILANSETVYISNEINELNEEGIWLISSVPSVALSVKEGSWIMFFLHKLTELGFWWIAKGNGVCVDLILYDIEYSTIFLILSSSQWELGVNGERKNKK